MINYYKLTCHSYLHWRMVIVVQYIIHRAHWCILWRYKTGCCIGSHSWTTVSTSYCCGINDLASITSSAQMVDVQPLTAHIRRKSCCSGLTWNLRNFSPFLLGCCRNKWVADSTILRKWKWLIVKVCDARAVFLPRLTFKLGTVMKQNDVPLEQVGNI